MDKLYIGDIPLEYKHAVFSSDYITLYNTANPSNGTYTYYRIYMYDSGSFYYSVGTSTFSSSYNSTTTTEIEVTDNFCYRRDFADICITASLFIVVFLFVFNIVTSSIYKRGVFGGFL